jgi:serine/threonine protein kinase
MARPGSRQSAGADGTRFGENEIAPNHSLPPLRAPLSVGSLIDGKYRLESLLGEGGMGSVWAAHNLQLDVPVAIKLLRPGNDQALLSERLKIEARAAARLVHPAIVRVFDVDTSESGDPFIVMELLGGESLANVLERGRISGTSAVQLLLPIAEGLELAHARGIVHRDLKPHNVMLAEDGERIQPKLLDFGIAKLTSGALPSSSLTDTGITVGSPDYMSPEQARGSNDVDYRADIWSFCVVLYEAVTGATPFDGDNYNALMRSIVEDEPAPLPLDENLDQGLADLILWGLSKDRAARPGSVHELGRELARWLLDRGVKEDACGAPLGPKWITRVAQRSAPVIHVDEPVTTDAPSLGTRPPPIVRTDTLVSPRLSGAVVRDATPSVGGATTPSAARRWWLIGAALLVTAGIFWTLRTKPAPNLHDLATSGASTAAKRFELETQARPEPSAPSVEIAATPPQPPSASAQPTLTDSVLNGGNSAPLGSSPARARDSKPHPDSAKPLPAARPASNVHDERRELLQAY